MIVLSLFSMFLVMFHGIQALLLKLVEIHCGAVCEGFKHCFKRKIILFHPSKEFFGVNVLE